MVEEFMLFVNIFVVKKIYEEFFEYVLFRKYLVSFFSNYDIFVKVAKFKVKIEK